MIIPWNITIEEVENIVTDLTFIRRFVPCGDKHITLQYMNKKGQTVFIPVTLSIT